MNTAIDDHSQQQRQGDDIGKFPVGQGAGKQIASRYSVLSISLGMSAIPENLPYLAHSKPFRHTAPSAEIYQQIIIAILLVTRKALLHSCERRLDRYWLAV